MSKRKPKQPTAEELERKREQDARQMPLPGTQTDKGPPPNWWRIYGQ